MGTPIAGYGAAGVGLGTGLNAIGQAQGLSAMRDAWHHQDAAQAGYDAQLRAKTAEFINSLNLGQALGTEQGQAQTAKMDANSQNTVAAVQKQAGRKKGGPSGGAETQARTQQALHATLANALQGNKLAGILAGLQQGGQQMDFLGRSFGQDSANIRGDAHKWAGLAPMQEQAAGMSGQWARQVGGLFSTLGNGAMMYGMSQPGAGAGAGTGTPGLGADAPLTGGLYSPGEASGIAGQRATYLTNADLPGWH